MMVAHPDDESIFGFSDLLANRCTVICLTQRRLAKRKAQFEEILSLTGSSGVILDYSHKDPWDVTDEGFYNAVSYHIKGSYDVVISHGADGEYGEPEHVRTHSIARYVASRLGLPFYDFRSRFNSAMYGEKHDRLIEVYIQEGMQAAAAQPNEQVHDKRLVPEGSIKLARTLLKYKYFFGEDILRRRIFMIGFNKTATSTMHCLFQMNSLNSCRNVIWRKNMQYDCYSDTDDITAFADFFSRFPYAEFILNTRYLEAWIRSRLMHIFKNRKNPADIDTKVDPLPNINDIVGWVKNRDLHYTAVLEFFKKSPERLIIVDIEQEGWTSFISDKLGLRIKELAKIPNNSNPVSPLPGDKAIIEDLIEGAFTKLRYTERKRKECFSYAQLKKCSLYKNNLGPFIGFIHIHKTGGTTIHTQLIEKLSKYIEHHEFANYYDNETYIIWLRNPIDRFVSEFNMWYYAINTDLTTIAEFNLRTCLLPLHMKRAKESKSFLFNENLDTLTKSFKDANDLAESLTSDDRDIRERAVALMNHGKGIGWSLENGDFVVKNIHKILFVGCQETMTEDMERLGQKLNIELDSTLRLRENIYLDKSMKYLSPLAIANIVDWYRDKDYAALKKLQEFGWITEERLASYYIYENPPPA